MARNHVLQFPLILLFSCLYYSQVKRCGEMSRKLRFFKDQIHKAGLMSSARPPLQQDLDLQELEVHFLTVHLSTSCHSFLLLLVFEHLQEEKRTNDNPFLKAKELSGRFFPFLPLHHQHLVKKLFFLRCGGRFSLEHNVQLLTN